MNRQDEAEALVTQLEAHPVYRVVRRLDLARIGEALTGPHVSQAVVLDAETTGMDAGNDKVIELALVKFEYDRETGAVGRCSRCCGVRCRGRQSLRTHCGGRGGRDRRSG